MSSSMDGDIFKEDFHTVILLCMVGCHKQARVCLVWGCKFLNGVWERFIN